MSSGGLKAFLPLALILGINQTTLLSNPTFVLALRGVYVALAVYLYTLWSKAAENFEQRKDREENKKPIWVKQAPGLMSMFSGGGGASFQRTTWAEVEGARMAQMKSSSMMGPAINLFLSFYMQLHIPLILALPQAFTALTGDEPLLSIYAFNKDPATVANRAGAGAEVMETDPETPSGSAGAAEQRVEDAPAPAAAAEEEEAAQAAEPSARCEDCEAVIDSVFVPKNDSAPDLAAVESLLEKSDKLLTYGAAVDGKTILHAYCVHPKASAKGVARLLQLGVDPCQQDREGWNALHWAASQNCAKQAEALCAAFCQECETGSANKQQPLGLPKLKQLLAAVDLSGRTAEGLAIAEGQEKVLAVIKSYTQKVLEEGAADSSE